MRVAVQYAPGDPVAFAAEADVLLLRDAEGWSFVPSEAVDIVPLASVDLSRPLADVQVRPGAVTRLRLSPAALELVESSIEVGVAAVLTGIASRILDMTVTY